MALGTPKASTTPDPSVGQQRTGDLTGRKVVRYDWSVRGQMVRGQFFILKLRWVVEQSSRAAAFDWWWSIVVIEVLEVRKVGNGCSMEEVERKSCLLYTSRCV